MRGRFLDRASDAAQRAADTEGGDAHSLGDLTHGEALPVEEPDAQEQVRVELGGAVGAAPAGIGEPAPSPIQESLLPLPEGDPGDAEGSGDLAPGGEFHLCEVDGGEPSGDGFGGSPGVGSAAGDEDDATALVFEDACGDADGSGLHGEERE